MECVGRDQRRERMHMYHNHICIIIQGDDMFYSFRIVLFSHVHKRKSDEKQRRGCQQCYIAKELHTHTTHDCVYPPLYKCIYNTRNSAKIEMNGKRMEFCGRKNSNNNKIVHKKNLV